MWFVFALALTGLLAAAGVAVYSIPASYATISDPPILTRSQHLNGPRCPGCGVVESMRQTGPPGNTGLQATFEVTVRFRDGSRAVYSEASPRTWRVGTRVVVVGMDALLSPPEGR
jgi:hypothetical protein